MGVQKQNQEQRGEEEKINSIRGGRSSQEGALEGGVRKRKLNRFGTRGDRRDRWGVRPNPEGGRGGEGLSGNLLVPDGKEEGFHLKC